VLSFVLDEVRTEDVGAAVNQEDIANAYLVRSVELESIPHF